MKLGPSTKTVSLELIVVFLATPFAFLPHLRANTTPVAPSQLTVYTNTGPRINAATSGLKTDPSRQELYAEENNRVVASILKELKAAGGGTIYFPDSDYPYYFGRSIFLIDNLTVEIEGTLKGIKDGGFHLLRGKEVQNVEIRGSGTLDQSAHTDGPRNNGSSCISFGKSENIIIQGVTLKDSPVLAINIFGSRKIKIYDTKVDNYYGSIKPDDPRSGVNQDGIHLYNSSDIHVFGNVVNSIDDCIAITFNENYDNFGDYGRGYYSNILIESNILTNQIATNKSKEGDGSISCYTGAGIRITDEGQTPNKQINACTIRNNTIHSGLGGIYLGTTSAPKGISVRSVEISNNTIIGSNNRSSTNNITKAETWSRLNRSLHCAILLSGVDNIKVTNNTIRDIPYSGLIIRSGTNIEVIQNSISNLVINNEIAVPERPYEFAALSVRTHSDVDTILFKQNEASRLDGPGIVIQRNGDTLLNNIRVLGNTVSHSNQLKSTDASASAFSSLVPLLDINFEASGNTAENVTTFNEAKEYSTLWIENHH